LILSFLASFLFPALKKNEKRILSRAVFFGVGMFALGASFAYFGMARVTILASIAFSEWLGFAPTIWFIDDYAAFLIKLVFGVGLAFELPVILLTLVRLGILNYDSLKSFRPYWVAINLIISALLTPQDVITQLLLAIPLQLLYEFSVLISWHWQTVRAKRGLPVAARRYKVP
jgi:sec-independent protein translocase protein TatC